jgi:hypothetical protein
MWDDALEFVIVGTTAFGDPFRPGQTALESA